MRIRVSSLIALVAVAVACNADKAPPPEPRPATPPPPTIDAPPAAPPDAMAAVDLPIPTTPVPDTPARKLWTPEIRDDATFADYSKELGGERFTKFVVDLKTDAIYYFDVDVYRVHKDFVFA